MTNRQISLDNIDRVENLAFVPLEKKYLKAHTAATALAWLGLMLLPLFIFLADELEGRNLIVICAEAVLLVAGLVNLAILPRAYTYKGYAVREHDITYRSGIVFPKTVTIPFCKVQQVSVRVRTLCCGCRERGADAGGDRHPRTDAGEGGGDKVTVDREDAE